MELQHITLDNLKPAAVNVRKRGGKDVADLVTSIGALGLLQPLLVRPNCEGYEIVAGQRRYHALAKLAEDKTIDPVPCLVMAEGDDAKAIEASLAENIARLPMDEIDQYKAFAALVKQGRDVADIASHFGITERLVKQRLALAGLIGPILTAYRRQEIGADTVRILTMATKRQQKAWWALFTSETDQAPFGYALRNWLFGGAHIPVENALFEVEDYDGAIISDLFGEDRYFDDAEKFWPLQNAAIATLKEDLVAEGWSSVEVLDIGQYWSRWEYVEANKKDGGRVFIRVSDDGEITVHAGYVTEKEAKRRKKAAQKGEDGAIADKPELTHTMQNYLDLHRHAAVRLDLLSHPGIAQRLVAAQIIAGSDLWTVHAERQKANTEAIGDSLAASKAEARFAKVRKTIRQLLGLDGDDNDTLVHRKDDWGKSHDLAAIFARLLALSDKDVSKVLTFAAAETLPCGNPLVEVLGKHLGVEMADHWQPDDTFFDLLRDKATINAILKEVAGKQTADSNVTSTAKVQKKIIRDCLSGERKPHKPDWQPRYMAFSMKAYTNKGGIAASDRWNAVKKLFKAA